MVMYELIVLLDPPKRAPAEYYRFNLEKYHAAQPEDTPQGLWQLLSQCVSSQEILPRVGTQSFCFFFLLSIAGTTRAR